ncbi:hypothetical protein P3T76_007081 [Phytophthora citrophthora]|uniref:RxLR effector protein n=1 Tax=Phytophthora citrophthora TaxID=4793 RepID=A0AAD9GMC0_9STRA|nr:hypothetical protein P3T76_007081 [Phytophthora citrophthora]
MHLSLILSIAIGAIYCATCNATPASHQNKVLATHVEDARMSNDVVDRRFLRVDQEKEETDKEERAFTKSGKVTKSAEKILADSTKATAAFEKWTRKGHSLDEISAWLKTETNAKYVPVYEGYQVNTQARGILADPDRAPRIFQLWQDKGFTLTQINNWLKDDKFLQVYNSYHGHLYG